MLHGAIQCRISQPISPPQLQLSLSLSPFPPSFFSTPGYYFIDALPQHLPSTGQTFFQNFQGKWGPLNGGLRWSAFKLHSELDPLVFQDGAKLVWRNGDVADPGRGKCRHEGSGPPVGSPGLAITRSLAYIYVW